MPRVEFILNCSGPSTEENPYPGICLDCPDPLTLALDSDQIRELEEIGAVAFGNKLNERGLIQSCSRGGQKWATSTVIT